MPLEIQTIDGCQTVCLTGALTVWEAADTWCTLLPLLNSAGPLTVDLGTVEQCDGAGLQIVCQLLKAAEAPERTVALSTPSAPLRAALERAGIAASLTEKV